MDDIKDCEALYPISGGLENQKFNLNYDSDDNMSNMSGYSSGGEFNSMAFMRR